MIYIRKVIGIIYDLMGFGYRLHMSLLSRNQMPQSNRAKMKGFCINISAL